jgi:Major Facilitator Superfamily
VVAALLLLGMAAVGLLAVVAQVLVAYAATLARPEERGRVVGAVTSGIVIGILLARTFAGLVTELAGWRAVYLASAALTLVLVVALLRRPAAGRAAGVAAAVRRAAAVDARAVRELADAARARDARAPDLRHVQLAVGIARARAPSALARGDRRASGVALALMLVAWVPIAFPSRLLALVVGLLLLDYAVQAVHVTNQSLLYATDPEARSRLAGAYMVFYSVGSAAGSIASTAVYAWAGLTGLCALGAALSATALVFWAAADGRASALRAGARHLGPAAGERAARIPDARLEPHPAALREVVLTVRAAVDARSDPVGVAEAVDACGVPVRPGLARAVLAHVGVAHADRQVVLALVANEEVVVDVVELGDAAEMPVARDGQRRVGRGRGGDGQRRGHRGEQA